MLGFRGGYDASGLRNCVLRSQTSSMSAMLGFVHPWDKPRTISQKLDGLQSPLIVLSHEVILRRHLRNDYCNVTSLSSTFARITSGQRTVRR